MEKLYANNEEVYRYIDNENYLISKSGKVYTTYVRGGQGRTDISKPWELSYGEDKDGYLRVVLSENSKKKYIKVHQIMAIHFLDYDPFSGLAVNHIDGNKQNNNIDNLEIVSPKENTVHAHKHYLCGKDIPVNVEYENRMFSFSNMNDCIRQFPDLSIHYLKQIKNREVKFSAILFKKNDHWIEAYHNGVLINTFDEMQKASYYYGKSRGAVWNALKCNEYRTKVNKYHITFPNVSTIEKTLKSGT